MAAAIGLKKIVLNAPVRAIDQFRADMPDLIDELITLTAFAWSEQPWIKGPYGSTPLGGGWMIKEWSAPEGHIYFAGDFTMMKTGWVEGAIESGLRAARQLDPQRSAAEGRIQALRPH